MTKKYKSSKDYNPMKVQRINYRTKILKIEQKLDELCFAADSFFFKDEEYRREKGIDFQMAKYSSLIKASGLNWTKYHESCRENFDEHLFYETFDYLENAGLVNIVDEIDPDDEIIY